MVAPTKEFLQHKKIKKLVSFASDKRIESLPQNPIFLIHISLQLDG